MAELRFGLKPVNDILFGRDEHNKLCYRIAFSKNGKWISWMPRVVGVKNEQFCKEKLGCPKEI